MPSEYFRENVYTTFQDDWVAFQMKDMCNIRRLMWANDFPHSDSTWPWSQEILEKHTKGLNEEEKNYILHDNVAELYHLETKAHDCRDSRTAAITSGGLLFGGEHAKRAPAKSPHPRRIRSSVPSRCIGASGVIEEEAIAVDQYHRTSIQLLKFTEGPITGQREVRFCYYDPRGRFQRSPLVVDEEIIAALAKALKTTPRLHGMLKKLVA